MTCWFVQSASRSGVVGIALLLVVLLSCGFPARALAVQRLALIIGNASYDTIGSLDNPVNDANDMAVALTGLGFHVTLGIDRDRSEMLEMISRFGADAKSADVALFYYAGHAFQISDKNYLLPRDFQPATRDEATAASVSLDAALNALAAAPGLKIVMLDACRDNRNRIPGGDDGLARVGSAADFLIAYATQPGAVASDGGGRNGTFTGAVLNHIRTPAQDISEMMIAVRKDVIAQSGGQQIPWESSSLTRRFFFDDGPPTASPDTMFYQVAVRGGDPSLLRLYLQRYPDGAHVSDVLALLTGGENGDTSLRSAGPDDDHGEQLWQLAQRSKLRPLFESYLKSYPQGPHVDAARQLLAELPSDADLGAARRCELLANHPRDGTETTPGVSFELLGRNSVEAIRNCEEAARLNPRQARYVALLARAYAASGLREKAIALYEDAAARGDLRAMVSLALLKEAGDGMPKDPAGALALYEKAAEGGSADAAINLAVTLLGPDQDEQSRVRGIALMRKASEGGSGIATFNLGVLARDGKFGDPADARALFERAAREGEPRAHRAAAVLLDEGRGGDPDPSAAAIQLLLGVASDGGELLGELTDHADNWNPRTLRALQGRLAISGLYHGATDGVPSPATRKALEDWRNGGFDAAALASLVPALPSD